MRSAQGIYGSHPVAAGAERLPSRSSAERWNELNTTLTGYQGRCKGLVGMV
jgi:hypothetical protein